MPEAPAKKKTKAAAPAVVPVVAVVAAPAQASVVASVVASSDLVAKRAAVSLAVPMVRLKTNPYKQNRIDLSLSGPEAQALRDLYDGLLLKGEFSHRKSQHVDALRWLLHQLEAGFAQAPE